MRLYHGTSERALESILKHGLQPRTSSKVDSNWPENPSHAECVYLTNCYAPYFAHVATEQNKNGRWTLLELEVAPKALWPDEDYLEQMTRDMPGPWPTGSMTARTTYFRGMQAKYKQLAVKSLESLGTCACPSVIPVDQLLRVSLFDSESNPRMAWMALDPSISLLNYRFMGSKYEALTRWFFEANTHVQDMCVGWEAYDDTMKQTWQEMVDNRKGITILQLQGPVVHGVGYADCERSAEQASACEGHI